MEGRPTFVPTTDAFCEGMVFLPSGILGWLRWEAHRGTATNASTEPNRLRNVRCLWLGIGLFGALHCKGLDSHS